jgi:PLP dependent protein
MSIKENILSVKDRIKSACIRSNMDYRDITLIAVSKTVDVNRMKEAIDSGVNVFGENKVQEIVDKHHELPDNIVWHMIGHLQSNKVRYLVDKVSMIHSVDSVKLVEEINKRFGKAGRIIDILVEINIGKEKNKTGINPEDIIEFLNEINTYPNIKICGLMTVAPTFNDNEKVRPFLKKMKDIFEEVKTNDIKNVNMKYISMGMTNDFEIAIEEGSNMIRIGSGIFGLRNYDNKGGKSDEQ